MSFAANILLYEICNINSQKKSSFKRKIIWFIFHILASYKSVPFIVQVDGLPANLRVYQLCVLVIHLLKIDHIHPVAAGVHRCFGHDQLCSRLAQWLRTTRRLTFATRMFCVCTVFCTFKLLRRLLQLFRYRRTFCSTERLRYNIFVISGVSIKYKNCTWILECLRYTFFGDILFNS